MAGVAAARMLLTGPRPMSVGVRSVLVLFLSSLAGCDPATPPAPRVEERVKNASGDRVGLARCLSECSAGELSATDRHTCRNNCEITFKTTPTAGEPVLDLAIQCMDKCHAAKGGASAACISDCKEQARPAEADSPGVLDRLEACVGECRADATLSGTDRWTCQRHCTQTAP
ncbi:hypothetical protein OV203_21905 [Nannocystis sp. ILAH1]|uniref:hypothetical protein n=1 Tax=Nannocystis sp. ILAH1 TaxID=2996789 RepID=UPI00226F6B45|nr:hypothetical protein [Nannocystis sp. ILAH1]MCY0989808.1 hypothetical protein [Nannocystis sp. ILAH1]